jgi:hypothetical protein
MLNVFTSNGLRRLLIIAFLFTIITISLCSCTDNQRVKGWGGTATLDLPAGEKLINITWKNAEVWYLTRDMTPTDTAITYKFSEKSSFGISEGTYIIKEHK